MADPVTLMALTLAGGAVSAGGSLLAGASQAQSATAQATATSQMLRQKAADEAAAAAVAARQKRRRADLAISRGRAVAAASGGNATDPTVLNVLGDIRKEGEYQAALKTWEGEQTAANLRAQAKNTYNIGQANASAAKTASYFDAAGTMLSAAGKTAGSAYYNNYGIPTLATDKDKTLEEFYFGGLSGLA